MSLDEFGDGPSPAKERPRPGLTAPPIEAEPAPHTADNAKIPGGGDNTQWSCMCEGRFMAAPNTVGRLPPGAYGFIATHHGIMLVPKVLNVDELLEFPDSRQGEIMQEIEDFWKTAGKFKYHVVLHRRGFIFHGPAGCGKTCLVQQIVSRVIRGGDIVFMMDTQPSLFRAGLHLVRSIEPTRRIVCVFEDLDAIIELYGDDEILSLLDGENQIDHVLNLATTNYPGRLDRRLVGRPRRFDRIVKVGMPSAKMREMYFIKKLNLSREDASKWVKGSDGFSFAACCELLISVMCLGRDFDKSVARLKEMMTTNPSNPTDVSTRVGFGGAAIPEEE